MSQLTVTPMLDQVSLAADLRELKEPAMRQAAGQQQAELVDAVYPAGERLGAGFGAAGLTVALRGHLQPGRSG